MWEVPSTELRFRFNEPPYTMILTYRWNALFASDPERPPKTHCHPGDRFAVALLRGFPAFWTTFPPLGRTVRFIINAQICRRWSVQHLVFFNLCPHEFTHLGIGASSALYKAQSNQRHITCFHSSGKRLLLYSYSVAAVRSFDSNSAISRSQRGSDRSIVFGTMPTKAWWSGQGDVRDFDIFFCASRRNL